MNDFCGWTYLNLLYKFYYSFILENSIIQKYICIKTYNFAILFELNLINLRLSNN